MSEKLGADLNCLSCLNSHESKAEDLLHQASADRGVARQSITNSRFKIPELHQASADRGVARKSITNSRFKIPELHQGSADRGVARQSITNSRFKIPELHQAAADRGVAKDLGNHGHSMGVNGGLQNVPVHQGPVCGGRL
jgi:hypothetical protein